MSQCGIFLVRIPRDSLRGEFLERDRRRWIELVDDTTVVNQKSRNEVLGNLDVK